MPNGERRSVVLRRANHVNMRHDVIDRFELYENDVEALDADLRLPEKYKEQQREKLRTALNEDVERLETEAIHAGFVALNDKEKSVIADIKQSPGDLTGVRAFLDSVSDVQTIVDFFDEELAIGSAPRLHKILPMILGRLDGLAKGRSDLSLQTTIRGVRAAADAWRAAHPAPITRLRAIRAEQDRINPVKGNEIGRAFDATRERLGMRVR
jgi:hypothetical protein